MCDEAQLLALARIYAAGQGVQLTTVSTRVFGSGAALARVEAGGITLRRARRALRWFSNHWPDNTPWPPDIPRPVPARPDPPASQATVPPSRAGIRQAVAAARARAGAAFVAEDWGAAEQHEQAAIAAALTLNAEGQIADPTALCKALSVPRYVYDDCVRRYAGHPERQPRAPRPGHSPSPTWRLIRALRGVGDRRFTHTNQEVVCPQHRRR